MLAGVMGPYQGILHAFNYPDYITDGFWELLGDMLEGQTGPHIGRAVQQLTDLRHDEGDRYGAKALELSPGLCASCSLFTGIEHSHAGIARCLCLYKYSRYKAH